MVSPPAPRIGSDPGTWPSLPLLDDARQFQLLVQSVVDYAIYLLDPQGRIARWNPGGHRIKGFTREEVLGRHFSMFYTQEDIDAGEPQRALRTAAETGKYEKEGWRVRKDGSRFWASVVIDPVMRDGQLIGFAKVTRDITDRHLAQLALEDAQRVMLQSQKMEAIGQLTYGLAHDFNNLLTVISNSLDSIGDAGDPERVRKAIAAAQRAADHGALLTRQLLAFSRGQWLKPKPSDINALVRAAETVLRRVCDEAVVMEFDLDPRLAPVAVDAAQLDAALLNLVINARDAMPQGGRLRIATRRLDPKPGRPVEVAISVSDTGTGMSPEVVARATEPFFTTKEVGKGSGLGLSQVYGFAGQSGGRLDIESTPGVGTTVTVRLPVMDQDAATAPARPLKVLMVDDDANIVEIVGDALREAGYDVLTAGDGVSAMTLLQQHPDIDVLFSDIVMPGPVSGMELARHALATQPDIKVLLASGYSESWLTDLPPQCVFVAKPYRATQVLQILRAQAVQRPQP